jgi:hypothetical protein
VYLARVEKLLLLLQRYGDVESTSRIELARGQLQDMLAGLGMDERGGSLMSKSSDVHGLASGQRPGQARPHRPSQAKPKVLAWSWFWPGLDFLKAKANGPGHGFEHYFFR